MNKSRAALQRLKQQEQSKKGASQGSAIDLCSSPDENRAPVVVDVDSGEEKEREAGKETAAEKRERRARRCTLRSEPRRTCSVLAPGIAACLWVLCECVCLVMKWESRSIFFDPDLCT